MERDGSEIVSKELQWYVNPQLVHFMEDECGFIVIEGIHSVIVSLSSVIQYVLCGCVSLLLARLIRL